MRDSGLYSHFVFGFWLYCMLFFEYAVFFSAQIVIWIMHFG